MCNHVQAGAIASRIIVSIIPEATPFLLLKKETKSGDDYAPPFSGKINVKNRYWVPDTEAASDIGAASDIWRHYVDFLFYLPKTYFLRKYLRVTLFVCLKLCKYTFDTG